MSVSSSKQVAQLVRMANQIALNMSAWGSEADVARKTEEHITKFWTPDMRRRLQEYSEQGGEDLSPAVLRVVDSLAHTH